MLEHEMNIPKFTEEQEEMLAEMGNIIELAMEMKEEDYQEFRKGLAEKFPIGADEMLKGLDEAREQYRKASEEEKASGDTQ